MVGAGVSVEAWRRRGAWWVALATLAACRGSAGTGAPPPPPPPGTPPPRAMPPAPVVGVPTFVAPPAPPPAPAPPKVRAGAPMGGGAEFTCALVGGEVACWGTSYYGQLGYGEKAPPGGTLFRARPERVKGIRDAVGLAVGDFHACVLRKDGSVACWGRNQEGQCGDGTESDRATPVAVAGLGPVEEISAGGYHTCARTGGEVWCWGYQYGAQPRPMPGLSDAIQLTGGSSSQCALRATGEVACWGKRSHGVLGDRRTDGVAEAPVPVDGITDAVEVRHDGFNGCVRHAGGLVSCWGWNLRGNLGDGTTIERAIPAVVIGVEHAERLWSYGDGFCVRERGRGALCWGGNGDGELGDGTRIQRKLPVTAKAWDEGEPMESFGAHSCVRRRNGTMACWGKNDQGQLGNGSRVPSIRPRTVALRGAPPPPAVKLELTVEQAGTPRPVASDGVVTLDRRPFTLVFRFEGPPAAFVAASTTNESFTPARRGARVDTIPGFRGSGMAEGPTNKQQQLLLSKVAPSFWSQQAPDRHRFDVACRTLAGVAECRRTVSSVVPDPRLPPVAIAALQSSLFVVAAPYRTEVEPQGPSKVPRVALELRFR